MAKNKIYIPYFISNESFAPAKVFPRIFFYNGTKECDIIKVQYYNTGSTLVTTDTFTAFPYFDHYSGQTTTTSSLSLLFLNEEPVYGTQPPSQSLFDKYWSNYINLLYDPKTRILRCNAVLPFDVYQNVELNDIIQLRSNYYHLRAINDYNLRTGECRLELLGPLLEGSMDNITFFDTTCLTASVISNVTNDTGSRIISFNITGSNCCNNPNELVVQLQYGTGSCPVTASNTIYVTIPNTNPASVSYGVLPGGVNCVTMSVANYCFGSDTGSYSFVFSGSLSGSYGNVAISGSATKEGCGVCQTASVYTTIVAQGTFTSSTSQVEADASASAYLTSVSQSNANTFGSCSVNIYYSTAISASVQKNDCTGSYTGSTEVVTLAASYSFDSCSQANAQAVAQAYFNSVSQSLANSQGYCQYFTRLFYTRPLYDIQDTSSLFPITVSAYTTLNTSSVPADNSPSWSVIGVHSGTLASVTQSFPVTTIISSSGQFGWDLIKFRGPGGEIIKIMDTSTETWGSNYLTEEYYAAPWANDTTASNNPSNTGNGAFPESKFKLYNNNLTQSLGGINDINFFGVQQAPIGGNRLTSSIGGNLEIYSLYTSSTTYPAVGDSKWTKIGNALPAGTLSLEVFLQGGGTLANATRRVFVTASNYFYFKATDVSGSLVNMSNCYVTTGSYVTASTNFSSSFMRVELSVSTASNDDGMTLVLKS